VSKKKQDEEKFEIAFYEGILKKKPDFFEALAALGDLYTKYGMYKEGLSIDERLAKIRSDDPTVLYNLACSYSLLNNIPKAFKTIKLAIKYGYDDFPFLEEDGDLSNLRNDSRFKSFFLKINKKTKSK